MINDELDPRSGQMPCKAAAIERVLKQDCEGGCDKHVGKVKLVLVPAWGYFAYCDVAIEEDRRRGLIVNVEE